MNIRAMKLVLISTVLTVALGGCQTLDPYTQESKTSNATKGAVIGAIAGAVVGLASGDDAVERRQHALIGAGVGALAGGAIGNYMDRQEAELRAELQGTGVSYRRQHYAEHAGQRDVCHEQFGSQPGILRCAGFRFKDSHRV
jgi:outer membrane lipoprotein SlyB